MNEHVRTDVLTGTTRETVETLSRRRWTTAELLALAEAGRLAPDEDFELIHGEVVAMPTEGPVHQDLRGDLTDFLIRGRPEQLRVNAEPQLNLSDSTYVNPDLVVRPAGIRMSALRGSDALLVIEIADSSIHCDTTTKAAVYAEHGVREYWVINARTLVTKVFRDPTANGYASATEVPPDEMLEPLLAPALAIRLADFG